ncbi:MAG: hypothetical protein WKG07_04010 [Hymenobacter sp.]
MNNLSTTLGVYQSLLSPAAAVTRMHGLYAQRQHHLHQKLPDGGRRPEPGAG